LIRFRALDAGPRFDFFTLTLDTADIVSSIDDEAFKTNVLEVFPNPASNGVFNIN